MSRRAGSLFRGSELPRLLFLVAVVVVGWPIVLLFAQNKANPPDQPPATPPVIGSEVTPVATDGAIEFAALRDHGPIQAKESAAYALLLRRARETTAAGLAGQARRDVLFTHLWERPGQYRGVPIHLEGTAKRVLTYEVNPNLAPGQRLFEAWVYSDENRKFPYVVAFEQVPEGMPIGPDVQLRVAFDGYFLKLLRYQAGDAPRSAPLLIGRLRWTPTAPPAAPMVAFRDWSKRDGIIVLFAVLLIYLALRGVFQLRRALAPSRPLVARSSPRDELTEGEVSSWLGELEGGKPSIPRDDLAEPV